jgi:hypothetical protein
MLAAAGFAVIHRPAAVVAGLRQYRAGPLWAAYARCPVGVITNRGTSMYLDTAGDQPASGTLSMADVSCVLEAGTVVMNRRRGMTSRRLP